MAVACEKSCEMAAFCKNCRDVTKPVNFDAIFQALYEKYKFPIYNFFYAKTAHNKLAAEDLTQETFIKAYRNLTNIEEYCNIIGWLYVIATNTFIDYQRKSKRKPFDNNPADLISFKLKADNDDDCPCHRLLKNDDRQKFRDIFKILAPSYRTALYLHEYENRSYAQAATIMNISVAAYTSLLNRARVKLKEAVIAYLFEVDINTLTKSEYKILSKWVAATDIFDNITGPINQEMQDYFNENAVFYNDNSYNDYHSLIDSYILGKYPLNREHIAADFGMGAGIFTSKLSHYVKRVDGYDYSKELCDIARENLKKNNINNVVCHHSDFTEFRDSFNKYDYAYCITVLHHLAYPQKTVEKMVKSLKNGGGLIISDFYKHKCSELVEKRSDLWYGFTKEQFGAFLTSAGLKNVWVEVHKKFPMIYEADSGIIIEIPTIIGGGRK